MREEAMKYSELTTKKARIEYIRQHLASDDHWALRALVRIYSNQTAEEQNIGNTVVYNGVGFNGTDGHILSSFAEQYQRRNSLSPKQMTILRTKIVKYAKQLEGAAQTTQERRA